MADPERPRWTVLAIAMVLFAGLFAALLSPTTALYWYVFPLFGLGAAYVLQFRSEFSRRWKVAFAGSAVLSAVALALDWPFSGHVLWNLMFIGHAWRTRRRRVWLALLSASLVHLLALKVVFQTPRDVVGAGISAVVAVVLLRLMSGPAPLRR